MINDEKVEKFFTKEHHTIDILKHKIFINTYRENSYIKKYERKIDCYLRLTIPNVYEPTGMDIRIIKKDYNQMNQIEYNKSQSILLENFIKERYPFLIKLFSDVRRIVKLNGPGFGVYYFKTYDKATLITDDVIGSFRKAKTDIIKKEMIKHNLTMYKLFPMISVENLRNYQINKILTNPDETDDQPKENR